jgi:hypothetical protein
MLPNTQEKYIKANTINIGENHLRICNFQVNHKNESFILYINTYFEHIPLLHTSM